MLRKLLRQKDIESDLKICTADQNSDMQTHAWVEIHGQPINEQPQTYEQLAAFDSSLTSDFRDFL